MANLPKRNAKGSEEDLYEAVGRYLSHWESLETRCCVLFGCLFEGPWSVAAATYGSLNGHHVRMNAISAANDAAFGEGSPERAAVRDVVKEVRQEGSFRNGLAHGQAHHVKRKGVEKGYFWIRACYDATSWPPDDWPAEHHSSTDINRRRIRLDEIKVKIELDLLHGSLRSRLLKLEPKLPGVAPQTLLGGSTPIPPVPEGQPTPYPR